MAKVRIEADGSMAHIYIDGQEVNDVKSYSIDHYAGECPIFKLELFAQSIEFDGDGIIPELMQDA